MKGQKNTKDAPLRTDFALGGADVVTLNQARDRALKYSGRRNRGNPPFNAARKISTCVEVAG